MHSPYIMSTGKTFRHGQILRLVSDQSIGNQEELRRRLAPSVSALPRPLFHAISRSFA